MPSSNPYRAPTEVDRDSTGIHPVSRIGIEFETDWTAAGLKLRRRSSWHRVFDVLFAGFSLLWLLSWIDAFSPGSVTVGLACMLTPIWMAVSVAWVSHLSHRNGQVFQRRFPGLAGRVTGCIDGNVLVLRGPSIDIAAATTACTQCHVFRHQALVQPPGIDTVLPISSRDIQRRWEVEPDLEKPNVAERLLQRLVSSDNAIHVGGILKGADLRGLPRYRQWAIVGAISVAVATLLFGWAVYRWRQLPQWVIDPPPHYLPGDQDRIALVVPILLTGVAAALMIYGLICLIRLWLRVGRFEAIVAPDMVAIADRHAAYGYHDGALNHFRWTEAGLLAGGSSGKLNFLVPRHWFSPSSQQQVDDWFGRQPKPFRKDLYLRPRI